MIELQNVFKSYALPSGPKTVLDGANLRVDTPKNIGLLGRNGAGKSTLLRIIAGTIPPDRGQVRRTGRYSWPLGLNGAFQGTLTGAENVDFVAGVYGVDRVTLRKFVYDFSELGEYFNQPVRTYSSGMRSRLSFGVSMGIEFDVYLVDEVTEVGDKRFKDKCREVFSEKLQNSRLIMVSHSEKTIQRFCEYAVVLERGALSEAMPVKKALKIHRSNMSS